MSSIFFKRISRSQAGIYGSRRNEENAADIIVSSGPRVESISVSVSVRGFLQNSACFGHFTLLTMFPSPLRVPHPTAPAALAPSPTFAPDCSAGRRNQDTLKDRVR